MDYINIDYAPNLLKFMKIKLDGKKTNSYYGFLKAIGEKPLPVFSDEQIAVIDYMSSLLPLVRRHEILIMKNILKGLTSKSAIENHLMKEITGCTLETIEHALRFMKEGKAIKQDNDEITLACEVEPELEEYLTDLLDYGLNEYGTKYKDEDDFLLFQDYRQDQALMKILDNPKHNQLGTYYKDGNMYVFAGLKKDDSVQEHLNYKDKFLDEKTFQWESIAHIKQSELLKQQTAKKVFVFVRKVSYENGLTLPFTFVGTGKLENPREHATSNGSMLYDISLDNPLPDYLLEDFKWIA